ncbi:ost-hth associated domain protein [Cyclospora cayetanensis]|uniref:Ost-hth associated domain protein n=1 Tax=Cyclospora cayetanensis TaxID=88456 RepID=A0A1D3D3Q1_9EIME|nr:ost-hth associated domain protein [Cyclospora cayetanensis]
MAEPSSRCSPQPSEEVRLHLLGPESASDTTGLTSPKAALAAAPAERQQQKQQQPQQLHDKLVHQQLLLIQQQQAVYGQMLSEGLQFLSLNHLPSEAAKPVQQTLLTNQERGQTTALTTELVVTEAPEGACSNIFEEGGFQGQNESQCVAKNALHCNQEQTPHRPLLSLLQKQHQHFREVQKQVESDKLRWRIEELIEATVGPSDLHEPGIKQEPQSLVNSSAVEMSLPEASPPEQEVQTDQQRMRQNEQLQYDRIVRTLHQLSKNVTPQQRQLLTDIMTTKPVREQLHATAPLHLPLRPFLNSSCSSPSKVDASAFWQQLILHIATLYAVMGLMRGAAMSPQLEYYKQMTDTCRVECQGAPGEEVVYLLHPPQGHPGWVDANNPVDPYPEELWHSFMQFVEALSMSDCSRLEIGGGRYGMARFLQSRNFAFLRGYSLGQLCHIVQLAISKRKVLAYEDNILKPVNQCKKVVNAFLRLPERSSSKNHISSVGELQHCILELLKANPGDSFFTHVAIRNLCVAIYKARHIKVIPVRPMASSHSAASDASSLPPLLPIAVEWDLPTQSSNSLNAAATPMALDVSERSQTPDGGASPKALETLTESAVGAQESLLRVPKASSGMTFTLMLDNGVGAISSTFEELQQQSARASAAARAQLVTGQGRGGALFTSENRAAADAAETAEASGSETESEGAKGDLDLI